MYTKPLPSQEDLRRWFDYHPDGYFVARMAWDNPIMPGTTVKGSHEQYPRVELGGEKYSLHRLIYMWHKGAVPDIVDHEDRNTHNARIGNLRDGTGGVNARNT